MGGLPEITEVKRLTVRPGDRIICRLARHPTRTEYDELSRRLKAEFDIEGVHIIVLTPDTDLEVIGAGGED